MRSIFLPLAVCAALAGTGCAQNALFEFYVEVPATGTTITPSGMVDSVWIAATYGRASDIGQSSGTRVFQLGATPGIVPVTLQRVTDRARDGVTIEVNYCRAAGGGTCDVVARERVYVERPFYTGASTCAFMPLTSGTFPRDEATLSACEVRGCINSAPDLTEYCRVPGDSSTHFCATRTGGSVCEQMYMLHAPRFLP